MKKLIALMVILTVLTAEAGEMSEYTEDWLKSLREDENRSYNEVFNQVVEKIKQNEGFREYPYADINGHLTIGYGFMTAYLPAKHRFYVSRVQADSILENKLRKRVKYAREEYPELNRFQVLAVASLSYNKGFGRIQRHTLHKQLKAGKVKEETWIYFSKYEVNRKNFREARIFEFKIYNYEIFMQKLRESVRGNQNTNQSIGRSCFLH